MLAYHDFLCAYNYYYCNIHFVCANGVTVCTDWARSPHGMEWMRSNSIYAAHRSLSLDAAHSPPPPTCHLASPCVFVRVSQDFSVSPLHSNRLIIYIILLRCSSVNDDAHGVKYVETHYIVLRIDRYNIRDTDTAHM